LVKGQLHCLELSRPLQLQSLLEEIFDLLQSFLSNVHVFFWGCLHPAKALRRWIYGEPPTEVSGPDRPAAGAATEKGGAQQPPDPDDGEGADQPRVAGPGGAAGCGEGAEVRRRKGGGDPPPSER